MEQTIELFGMKLKVVEDDGMVSCQLCTLKSFCDKVNEMAEEYPDWNYPTICMNANHDVKQHFERVE